MAEIIHIPISGIQMSKERPVVESAVKLLAESIKMNGLINPVSVRAADTYQRGTYRAGHIIIGGNHRVEAFKLLGRTEIPAIVHDVSWEQAMLMGIDENLAREELTAAQRAHSISQRREFWQLIQEEATQESGARCATLPKTGRGNEQFASATSEATGISKSSINRDLRRATELGDDLRRVEGTSLDNGKELDALIKMPEPERKEIIQRAAAGEKVSARKEAQMSCEALDIGPRFLQRAVVNLSAVRGDMDKDADAYEIADAVMDGIRMGMAGDQLQKAMDYLEACALIFDKAKGMGS